ncbi:hypothetical protein JW948_01545 [bacterium]|nr:hypothetical protein [bacterium]
MSLAKKNILAVAAFVLFAVVVFTSMHVFGQLDTQQYKANLILTAVLTAAGLVIGFSVFYPMNVPKPARILIAVILTVCAFGVLLTVMRHLYIKTKMPLDNRFPEYLRILCYQFCASIGIIVFHFIRLDKKRKQRDG